MKIDSHQHFWQYNEVDYVWMGEVHNAIKKNFLPDDLQPLLKENNLDGSIAVQARQTIAETNFLLGLASNNSIIKGVVGWLPLCETDVEGMIEKYAAEKNIVGFRHVIHDEPDDLFILRKDFNNGIKCLKHHSLCYDILIFEKHLPQAIKFVDQHPEIKMVIDHIAKPRISNSKFDHTWAENIKQLSARENVTCKLSGMVTEVIDGKWDKALLQPYFDIVLEAFGPDRLMFGSDWPVSILGGSYSQIVKLAEALTSHLSPSEADFFWYKTATAAYGLA